MKQSVGQTFGTLQTPTDIKEQLQAHSFMPQEGPKCDQMGMLTASGQALQQTAACHPDELVKQRGLGCEMPTDCTCGPTLRASVDFGARAFNYSYMIPLHPTKPSLPPQHQQQPCSHIRAPTILPAQQSSQTPVTAPAPSVVKSIRMTLPHTPPTANLQEDINASKKRLLSHSMLLRRLQQLGNSLAEAARLGHLQRMHFILQLLSSCPVSAHLLASSHVAVTPRHVLKQLQQQHDRPCQQQMQPMQHTLLQEQLRQQVAQTAQQLLQQWRAVLVSEVTSADKPRLLQARKVISHSPLATQQPALTLMQHRPQAIMSGAQQQMTGSLYQRQETRTAAPADTSRRKRPALQQASQVIERAAAAGDASAAVSKRQRTDGQRQLPPATAPNRIRPATTAARKSASLQKLQQEGTTAVKPSMARPKQGSRAAVRKRILVPKVRAKAQNSSPIRSSTRPAERGRPDHSGAGRASPATATATAATTVTAAPQTIAGLLPLTTVAAAAAGNGITSVPGTWLKLDLGTTTILPKGRRPNSPGSTIEVLSPLDTINHHQQPRSAAAAAAPGVLAGRGSAMWGAGAKALRAAKGPGSHHGHGHHPRGHTQQALHPTAGVAGAAAASHVGAAVQHAFPPTRQTTTATHASQYPSGTDGVGEHVGAPQPVTGVASSADDLRATQTQTGSQATLPDHHTQQQWLHPTYAGITDGVTDSNINLGFLLAPLTSAAASPPAAIVAGDPTGKWCSHNCPCLDQPPPATYITCAPTSASAALEGAGRGTLHGRGSAHVTLQPYDDYVADAGADDALLVDMRQQDCAMLVMEGLVLSPAL